MPGSRKTVKLLWFLFFSCSEHCFKEVVGREVSERPGTAEGQSWAAAGLTQSRETQPWVRKAEKLLQACSTTSLLLGWSHLASGDTEWLEQQGNQLEKSGCAWSLIFSLGASFSVAAVAWWKLQLVHQQRTPTSLSTFFLCFSCLCLSIGSHS